MELSSVLIWRYVWKANFPASFVHHLIMLRGSFCSSEHSFSLSILDHSIVSWNFAISFHTWHLGHTKLRFSLVLNSSHCWYRQQDLCNYLGRNYSTPSMLTVPHSGSCPVITSDAQKIWQKFDIIKISFVKNTAEIPTRAYWYQTTGYGRDSPRCTTYWVWWWIFRTRIDPIHIRFWFRETGNWASTRFYSS